MNIQRSIVCMLALFPVLAICDEPNVKLGASFKKVWFKGGKAKIEAFRGAEFLPSSRLQKEIPTPATPLVGIEIDMATLKNAILSAAKDHPKLSELLKQIEALNEPQSENKNYWTITSESLGKSKPVAYQHEEDLLVLILSQNGSYNDSYAVSFDVGKFLDPSGESRILTQNDVHLMGRSSLTVDTDFANNEATLLTGAKKNAKRVDFGVAYEGFPNPLQQFIFREHSYYRLKLSGTLSDQKFDPKSRLELSLNGVTDFLQRGSGYVGIAGFRVLTSQSQRQNTYVYEVGFRKGDRRESSDQFVAADDLLGTVYGEAALQVGYSHYKDFDEISDKPKRSDLLIVRPRFRVGVKNLFKSKESFLRVSGFVDLYHLFNDLGGGDAIGTATNGNGFRERFEVNFAIGTEAQAINFSIEGGTNPAQGFIKLTPTYKLGINFKF